MKRVDVSVTSGPSTTGGRERRRRHAGTQSHLDLALADLRAVGGRGERGDESAFTPEVDNARAGSIYPRQCRRDRTRQDSLLGVRSAVEESQNVSQRASGHIDSI